MDLFLKQTILLLVIIYLSFQPLLSQFVSKNNYKGDWETPASWNPVWTKPESSSLSGYYLTINGFITVNGNLSFTGTASNLIIEDTLVIKGNLLLENNSQIIVMDNGKLIVMGNLIINNQSIIIENGTLVVANDLTKNGAIIQGLFTSNDNPVRIYICGTVSPELTTNNLNLPVLNCTAPITDPYPNTSCSYGNLADLKNDPIYTFFKNICTRSNVTRNISACIANTLYLTSSNGTSFSWSGPDGFTSNLQNPAIPKATSAMAGNYILIYTVGPGCSDNDTINVTVNPLPVVTAGSNSPVCTGSPINLTASEGTAFSWGGPRGFTSKLQNPVIPDATMPMAGTYTVTVTASTGCRSTNATSVIISEMPVADAGPDQKLKFVFNTKMQANLSSSWTGEWSVVSGSGQFKDIHLPISAISDLSTGDNKFLWTVYNGGCIATDEVKITVEDLFIPSVITPDGDGKNDVFRINALDGSTVLTIFNRWGIVEYSNSNYSNNWDGKNNKGGILPEDTYFYILNFKNGLVRKGTVLIVR